RAAGVRRGRVVGAGGRALVVELDQDGRAVDPVVEDTVLVSAAHPREVRMVEMALDLVPSRLGVARPDTSDVRLEHVEQHALLGCREVARRDALVLHLDVVTNRRGDDFREGRWGE